MGSETSTDQDDQGGQSGQKENALRLKVSVDQVFEADLKTDLAKFGGNDSKNTVLSVMDEATIYAYGWAAASIPIVKYGYRYGDEIAFNTAPQNAEAAVLAEIRQRDRSFVLSVPLIRQRDRSFVLSVPSSCIFDWGKIDNPAK